MRLKLFFVIWLAVCALGAVPRAEPVAPIVVDEPLWWTAVEVTGTAEPGSKVIYIIQNPGIGIVGGVREVSVFGVLEFPTDLEDAIWVRLHYGQGVGLVQVMVLRSQSFLPVVRVGRPQGTPLP